MQASCYFLRNGAVTNARSIHFSLRIFLAYPPVWWDRKQVLLTKVKFVLFSDFPNSTNWKKLIILSKCRLPLITTKRPFLRPLPPPPPVTTDEDIQSRTRRHHFPQSSWYKRCAIIYEKKHKYFFPGNCKCNWLMTWFFLHEVNRNLVCVRCYIITLQMCRYIFWRI